MSDATDVEPPEEQPDKFPKELERLLNCHSQENRSNTPDFILAEYLLGCLASYNAAVRRREEWCGRGPKPSGSPMDQVESPATS